MKKSFVQMGAAAMIAITGVSCAPDPIYSYPPEYERTVKFSLEDPRTLTLDRQNDATYVTRCQPGDSLTALIRVAYTGAHITRAVYYWTLKGADGEKIDEKKFTEISPHQHIYPPMWVFEAPDSAGTYEMHFRATYVYSASTEEGAIFGGFPTSASYEGASTVKAPLTVQ